MGRPNALASALSKRATVTTTRAMITSQYPSASPSAGFRLRYRLERLLRCAYPSPLD